MGNLLVERTRSRVFRRRMMRKLTCLRLHLPGLSALTAVSENSPRRADHRPSLSRPFVLGDAHSKHGHKTKASNVGSNTGESAPGRDRQRRRWRRPIPGPYSAFFLRQLCPHANYVIVLDYRDSQEVRLAAAAGPQVRRVCDRARQKGARYHSYSRSRFV